MPPMANMVVIAFNGASFRSGPPSAIMIRMSTDRSDAA